MISRIEAHHYRCFEQLDIAVGPYQVIAGANGSGKSTLLDIPVLLGDMLEKGVIGAFLETTSPGRVARAQNLNELVYRGVPDGLALAVEARLPEDIVQTLLARASKAVRRDPRSWPSVIRYEVSLGIISVNARAKCISGVGFQVKPVDHGEPPIITQVLPQERLSLVSERARPDLESSTRNWHSPSGWTAGSGQRTILRSDAALEDLTLERWTPDGSGPKKPFALPTGELQIEFIAEYQRRKMNFQFPSDTLGFAHLPPDTGLFPAAVWFKTLLQKKIIRYEPDLTALRSACPPGQPRQILRDAVNLPWQVLRLKSELPERFDAWVEHARTALPNLQGIQAIEREDDHHVYLKLEYEGGFSVTSSGLSDGTLRILALTILPYLPDLPHLIAIEEPENGIHPRAIETVLQSLSSVYDGQVWLSTHSPVVLAGVSLNQIVCMRRSPTGAMEAVLGDQHPRLADWKGGIDLGSLFAAGVLE